MALPRHFTLADALPRLREPDRYLYKVKPKMAQCYKTNGSALLRIGSSSSGKYPSFRVSYDKDGSEIWFGSYFDSGKPFPNNIEDSDGWCHGVMSWEEFQELLARFQGT